MADTTAYKSVRDLIATGNKTVNEVLKEFTDNYEICEFCNGVGYHLESEKDVEFYEGVTSVKFKGNPTLERLKDNNQLTSSTINKMIETVIYGRFQCGNCEGEGFNKKY